MASLSDDVIYSIIEFLPTTADLCRFASTSHKWHKRILQDTGEESDDLWFRSMERMNYGSFYVHLMWTAEHYAELVGADEYDAPKYVRRLLLLCEQVIWELKRKLKTEIKRKVAEIRNSDRVYGATGDYEYIKKKKRATGTTATSSADSSGSHAEYVYYDWEDNWTRVSELMNSKDVQGVLKACIKESDPNFTCDEDVVLWPYECDNNFALFSYEYGEPVDLYDMFLPNERKKELNHAIADWMKSRIDTIIEGERHGNSVDLLVPRMIHVIIENLRVQKTSVFNRSDIRSYFQGHYIETIKSNVLRLITVEPKLKVRRFGSIDGSYWHSPVEDEVFFSLQSMNTQMRDLHLEWKDLIDGIMSDLEYEYEAYEEDDTSAIERVKQECGWDLFSEDCPMRSLALESDSRNMAPLKYQLALLLSPPGTSISVYANDSGTAIVDEARRIVFDTHDFFLGSSAADHVSSVKERPQYHSEEFDYTLGGLRSLPKKLKQKRKKSRKSATLKKVRT